MVSGGATLLKHQASSAMSAVNEDEAARLLPGESALSHPSAPCVAADDEEVKERYCNCFAEQSAARSKAVQLVAGSKPRPLGSCAPIWPLPSTLASMRFRDAGASLDVARRSLEIRKSLEQRGREHSTPNDPYSAFNQVWTVSHS